ncbi:hypothetical protein D9613_012575 [Agrocybe pediades]|uniref:F-box domain-containing protein n=1 Tax=Agrocybe pediades TaxID=84607 RepID=A0A8H4R1E9_9AGAR|nr:hypothetical protein D9613_012575 [Agrocybe pediades]
MVASRRGLYWSSPVRREGTRTLSPIPNEIYLEIFSYVKLPYFAGPALRRDMSSLAQVCRFFCSVMLPWIYEHLIIDAKVKDDGISNTRAAFCQRLARGEASAQEMALFVRKCTIKSWVVADKEADWCSRALLRVYSKALCSMTNIRVLELISTTVTKDLITGIAHLPNLESLTVKDCRFSPGIAAKHVDKIHSLKLKKLCVYLLDNREHSWDPTIDDLILSSINLAHLIRLETNSTELCARLGQTATLHLEHLDFRSSNIDDAPLLQSILPHTKTLKRLCYSSCSRAEALHLLPEHLPVMASVKAPLEYVKALVPGRPVSSVECIGWEDPAITLADILVLRNSKAPIEHIHVLSSCYMDIPLFDYFPQLKSLELTFLLKDSEEYSGCDVKQDLEQDMLTIFRKWPKNPDLQDIVLTFDIMEWAPLNRFDLQIQHHWVSDIISPLFPSLSRCQFDKSIDWFYSLEDLDWRPHVVVEQAQNLLKGLKSGMFEDYDNFFTNLLNQDQWI